MKFSSIPACLQYPKKHAAKLSTLHSDVVAYMEQNYNGTKAQKSEAIRTINAISFLVLRGDTFPKSWDVQHPLESIGMDIDMEVAEHELGNLFVCSREVVWDIDTKLGNTPIEPKSIPVVKTIDAPTPKEHLYIKCPSVPQFEFDKPWKRTSKGCIYRTLPIIPKTQNQISVTTNVDEMSDADVLVLFPNRTIQTRSPVMYQHYDNMSFDSVLGCIFPIEGFTELQVMQNIIEYPHLYKLYRIVDGKPQSAYAFIEINGELVDIRDIWESTGLPKSTEFMKEYAIRRYLLERDICGAKHMHPIFGSLEPFLTLFTTPDIYKSFGYANAVSIARNCVMSRVKYLQTRNPVIRDVF